MDEDLSIINANTRNEKIKNFFIKNRNKIISVIVILILILISFYSYDKYSTSKKKNISDSFNSITIEHNEDIKEKTANKLIEIINKKDPTYSPLSLYFIIDNKLVTDLDTINSLFDVLIDQTALDEEIKNLTIYKKALFNADFIKENDLLELLNPLINSKSIWNSHALYLIAEYFYFNNQREKSKEFFNRITVLENSNSQIRTLAEKRLTRDLSD